jgi:hypothetical protein
MAGWHLRARASEEGSATPQARSGGGPGEGVLADTRWRNGDPDDELVVQKLSATAPIGPKRYDYQCSCGYSFKSGIPPQLIKCPDCMGKPKLVGEVEK